MSEQITYEGVLRLIQEGTAAFQRDMEEMRRERQESAAEYAREKKERDAEFAKMRQETERQMQKTDQQIKKTDQQIKRTSKEVGNLTGNMGKVIEHMVAGDNIIAKFQDLNYKIGDYSRNKKFGRDLPREFWGEIDLFLENGDIAILIEVKTTLETKDVRTHIERLEKFRRVADIKGDRRRSIGAVAVAVIDGDAENSLTKTECMLLFSPAKPW